MEMVICVQRYFSTIKIADKFLLNNDDLYHIKTVMRMRPWDRIEVVYQKEMYICELNDKYEVKIIEKKTNENNQLKEITLVVPLVKEQKMALILQKSTELGVARIIPVQTERSIIKLDENKEHKKIIRWQKIIKEASEQSKRLDIPVLSTVKSFEQLKELDGLRIVCSTAQNTNTLKSVLKSNRNYDKITVLMGPEGGLTLAEEEKLVSYGFIRVTLGSLIMRVETVPMFILSALNYENME